MEVFICRQGKWELVGKYDITVTLKEILENEKIRSNSLLRIFVEGTEMKMPVNIRVAQKGKGESF